MVDLVKGRSCAGCTLCCKVVGISELQKPRDVWCSLCEPTHGCKAYSQRSRERRGFYCGYLTNPSVDENWKPSKCRMVITYEELEIPKLSIYVDTSRLNVWRQEPYYSQIKLWAVQAATRQGQVIIWQGRNTIVVLPDREKDLGEVKLGKFIVTIEKPGPIGRELDAIAVGPDDPIFKALRSAQKPPGPSCT